MATMKVEKLDALLWLKWAALQRAELKDEPDAWKREALLARVEVLEGRLRKIAEDGEGKGDESDGK